MKSLSEKLGFFFALFQRDLSGKHVKCWLDGSEDWVFFDKSEFLNLAENDTAIIECFKDALSQSSMFLWDVDARKVTRLKVDNSNFSQVLPKLKPIDKLQINPNKKFETVKWDKGKISIHL